MTVDEQETTNTHQLLFNRNNICHIRKYKIYSGQIMINIQFS
jgi:hypothetical protein